MGTEERCEVHTSFAAWVQQWGSSPGSGSWEQDQQGGLPFSRGALSTAAYGSDLRMPPGLFKRRAAYAAVQLPTSGIVIRARGRCVFCALLHGAMCVVRWRLQVGKGSSCRVARGIDIRNCCVWWHGICRAFRCARCVPYLMNLINISIRGNDRPLRGSKIFNCQVVFRECFLKHPMLQDWMSPIVDCKPCQSPAIRAIRLEYLNQLLSLSILTKRETSFYQERSTRVSISFPETSLSSSMLWRRDSAHLAKGIASASHRVASTTPSIPYIVLYAI